MVSNGHAIDHIVEARPMMRRLDSVLEEVGDTRDVRVRTCTAAMLCDVRRTLRTKEALIEELTN